MKVTDQPSFIALVKENLEMLPFVKWDRFTYLYSKGSNGICIYGWIDREKDAYKDFITMDIYEDGDVNYMTSSSEWSLKIFKILNDSGLGHQNCKRIEDFFNVDNAIKLKKA